MRGCDFVRRRVNAIYRPRCLLSRRRIGPLRPACCRIGASARPAPTSVCRPESSRPPSLFTMKSISPTGCYTRTTSSGRGAGWCKATAGCSAKMAGWRRRTRSRRWSVSSRPTLQPWVTTAERLCDQHLSGRTVTSAQAVDGKFLYVVADGFWLRHIEAQPLIDRREGIDDAGQPLAGGGDVDPGADLAALLSVAHVGFEKLRRAPHCTVAVGNHVAHELGVIGHQAVGGAVFEEDLRVGFGHRAEFFGERGLVFHRRRYFAVEALGAMLDGRLDEHIAIDEVPIDGAPGDLGHARHVLHAGPLDAQLCKAFIGGIENLVAPIELVGDRCFAGCSVSRHVTPPRAIAITPALMLRDTPCLVGEARPEPAQTKVPGPADQPRNVVLVSRYSIIPARPFSRPKPDCFIPPNGACGCSV